MRYHYYHCYHEFDYCFEYAKIRENVKKNVKILIPLRRAIKLCRNIRKKIYIFGLLLGSWQLTQQNKERTIDKVSFHIETISDTQQSTKFSVFIRYSNFKGLIYCEHSLNFCILQKTIIFLGKRFQILKSTNLFDGRTLN